MIQQKDLEIFPNIHVSQADTSLFGQISIDLSSGVQIAEDACKKFAAPASAGVKLPTEENWKRGCLNSQH